MDTNRLRRQSATWINTAKKRGDGPVGAALCVQAGLTHQMASGLHALLPLGQRVLDNIETIIRQEVEAVGAVRLSVPTLQSAEMWKQTGRWDVYGPEMIRLQNRQGQELCMTPTSEEAVTSLAGSRITSYRQLPMLTYQTGQKYRDELRPRGGLLRTREFTVFDAYSFDIDRQAGEATYQEMRAAYERIMVRLGLEYVFVEADAGEIGGDYSEMLLCPAPSGDDAYVIENGVARQAHEGDKNPISAIEIGHLLMLGARYTEPLDVAITNESGDKSFLYGGCYGIGLTRLLPTIIEQHHDDNGISWPKQITPFDVIVLPLGNDEQTLAYANMLDTDLRSHNVSVLTDWRSARPGAKFGESALIGIPWKLIVGRDAANGIVQLESRDGQTRLDASWLTQADDVVKLITGQS